MLYENVFWDWNGTLLDDTRASLNAINLTLAKRNMPRLDEKEYAENFRFPVKDYYLTLGFDFTDESYELLAEEFIENYLAQKSALRVGAKKTLEKLFLNSVNQYILSACERGILEKGLTDNGIRVFFKGVVALDDHRAVSKLEAGREFLSKNAVSGKSLMVGDTEHDAEVAAALGMDCVLIESGNNSRGRLERTGARIIDSLEELTCLVLGDRRTKPVDYMTPAKAERRSFDLSETTKRFKETYRSFYNDVKNTTATEDW